MTKQTVLNYQNKGLAGSSPLKRGPDVKLLSASNFLVQAHIEMKQLEGVSETKPKHVKALIGASFQETNYEGMGMSREDYLCTDNLGSSSASRWPLRNRSMWRIAEVFGQPSKT